MNGKKTKVIIVTVLILMPILLAAGCSKKTPAGTTGSVPTKAPTGTSGSIPTKAPTFIPTTSPVGGEGADREDIAEMSLENMVEELYSDVDVPPYETVLLDSTNFEYFTFAPYDDSLTAVAADALVNITPHSMVIIHSPKGGGADLAKTVAANADLNKWLCVGSETGNVLYTEHYVVLIMSEKVIVDAVTENFEAMSADLDGMMTNIISLTNSRYEQ